MTDLADADATALLALFAAGTATPVDALEAAERRLKRHEPSLNAMTSLNPRARAEAEASAARWRAGTSVPLDGVPVTIKDNLVAAGLVASFGSTAYRDNLEAADELPVARVRRAGAVVLGKTNLPEFALDGHCINALFGSTGNPHDPALTPGGSSGGAAASVAAGYAPIGLGTDAGGSLRRPAAHCGLFALKTTAGRVPRAGGLPQLLLDFEVAGGLTRTLRDTHLLDAVLTGRAAEPIRAPGRLRILAVERLGEAPLDPAIASSFRATAATMSVRHDVQTGSLPIDTDALAAVWPDIGRLGLAGLFAAEPHRAAMASPASQALAAEGRTLPPSRMKDIQAVVSRCRADADAMFHTVDLLLMPAIAALAWERERSHPAIIDGTPVGPRGHAIYTGWVNAAGLPALAFASTPAPDGRRIGLQLVAARGQDQRLIDTMTAEREAGDTSHSTRDG